MSQIAYQRRIKPLPHDPQANQLQVRTLEQIIDFISSSEPASATRHLRAIPLTDSADRQEYKKNNFEVAIFAASHFKGSSRSNADAIASGYTCLDFDHIPSDVLASLYEWLSKDEYVHLMFYSPSGDGIKVVIKIPLVENDAEYKRYLHVIGQYMQEVYQYRIDPACKDIARATFLPYAPDLYYNPNSLVWDIAPEPATVVQPSNTPKQPQPSLPASDWDVFDWCVETMHKKGERFINGSRNAFINKLAVFANSYGIKASNLESLCVSRFEQADFSAGEIKSTIRSVYANPEFVGQHATREYKLKQAEKNKPIETVPSIPKQKSALKILTANQTLMNANQRAIPKKLFGPFWYEDEVCIFFADTNIGKSIAAVQIGDSISSGKGLLGFECEAPAQPVIYCDFELSDKQFELRYSQNCQNHYPFSDNFFRAEINPDADLPEGVTFEDYLIQSLEAAILETTARVIIIDNITYLRVETERAKDALPLMKQLKALKSRYGLSILALAHTPKRNMALPLGRNDLQGSKMLINFCDTSFALGESFQDSSLRYFKQIKVRNSEHVYDTDNVLVCQIGKPYNFLHFEFIGFGREKDHLKEPSEKDRQQIIEQARELSKQGKSQREIAKELSISVGAVNKYLK